MEWHIAIFSSESIEKHYCTFRSNEFKSECLILLDEDFKFFIGKLKLLNSNQLKTISQILKEMNNPKVAELSEEERNFIQLVISPPSFS